MKKTHIAAKASRRALPRAALAASAAFLLGACSKGAALQNASGAAYAVMDDATVELADYDEAAFAERATFTTSTQAAKSVTQEAPVPAPDAQEQKSAASRTYERKLIRIGHIRLEVDSLAEAKGSVEGWVKRYGGYIASSNEGSSNASFTVKIPSARFDEAMGETSSFGKVLNKNVNSQNVTERYYDLKTRLETKRVMQERLENYLKSAKNVKDMLEIESQLNNVTADLESMQGQLNRLSSQVDFSEITIYARLRSNRTEQGFSLPNVSGKFSDLASNVISFFVGLLFVIIYIAIFGIPIVLLLALLYWLCFGKSDLCGSFSPG